MSADADRRDDSAARMRRSWQRNAKAWIDTVRGQRIASRRAGTDASIVDAVLGANARRVIDIGCGEGWLARALAARGCDVVGIDASAALIDAARASGGARFEVIAYDGLAAGARSLGAPFDAAVCNFSLLDDAATHTLRAVRTLLGANGRLIVQTVHPWTACADHPYADGWRTETFADFGADFVEPMPWYFRTLGSWLDAIRTAGFAIERCNEPLDAAGGRPLSLLIHAIAAAQAES